MELQQNKQYIILAMNEFLPDCLRRRDYYICFNPSDDDDDDDYCIDQCIADNESYLVTFDRILDFHNNSAWKFMEAAEYD